jgi:signal peptidase I
MAVVVARLWILDGLPTACRVSGGSMAETLLGTHRAVVCADCGHRFPCDAEALPLRQTAVCPNCGYVGNLTESSPDQNGDLVWLDRASFRVRRPRRWELAAFWSPDRGKEIAVKRVVGLPGESVQVRHGDIYIDGRIERKSLAQQHALGLLVHDANCEPRLEPRPPRRWRPDTADSAWTTAGGNFSHPASAAAGPVDWLTYHHWRRLPGSQGKVETSPVTDLCGYNSSRARREEDLHPVADLLLSMRLTETSGRGVFILRATDGVEDFQASVHFGEKPPWFEVSRGGQIVPGARGNVPFRARTPAIEISLIDQQFLLAFDGQTVVTLPYDRSGAPCPPATPLAIGVQGLGVVLTDLRVYRDVYYTRPIGSAARWGLDAPVTLAADEYFLLGDNSPISEDSRTWTEGCGVDAKRLVGKPLAIAIPSRSVQWFQWHFQVPNPLRMRYIR